nr:MAG TPA: hypothetical protein [Caudoviricetes sp.]
MSDRYSSENKASVSVAFRTLSWKYFPSKPLAKPKYVHISSQH